MTCYAPADFETTKKNIQKHTLGVTGPMKTNIKWSSGWLVWDDFQVELYRNTKIVIWEAVFCTKYNGILQNQCNPVSIPHSRQFLLKRSSWLSLILGSWTRPQFIDFQYILYMFWGLCSEEFNHLVKNLII